MSESRLNKLLEVKFGDAVNSILNSYAQVFFSTNRIFAIILLVVSFFDIYAGISGLLAIITANLFALLLGMKRRSIIDGAYGFNPLMVGLGIGIYYQPGAEFYLLLVVVSLLTLLVSLSLEGIFYKYGIPFLSIPFLIGIWFVLVASRDYSALELSERGIYSLNDMFAIGGISMVNLYHWFNELPMNEALRVYFKSLSAILFQYHLFAGLLLAVGLIIYSRISFLISIIGFFAAYFFYEIIGADISELSYSYIGFNYILMSIAIGGYFIVPSRNSVLWVILLTPLVAVILSSTSSLFAMFGLSVYSLPFNIIVLIFLYVLKLRESKYDKIVSVVTQMHSPELNAYYSYNYLQRFGAAPVHSMKLPFWGVWTVTQGFNGEITHKDLWLFAWDFELFDDAGNSYSGNGDFPEDYYCYGKPVVAPADGKVVAIESNIADNIIGETNLNKNWGNSVVIEHGNYFYSQLSHLKQDSVKVVIGQYVKQGEIIGAVGNTGRSPYPHLHMQFQASPDIGSPTIDYPFSSLLLFNSAVPEFRSVYRPATNDKVSNINISEVLSNAYSFDLGSKIIFNVTQGEEISVVTWIAEADIYNNRFLRCSSTGDKAWFNSTGDLFYFTHYEGKRKSLLFYFYMSSFKLAMSFNSDMIISDNLPLNIYQGKSLLLLQDFLMPFIKILKSDYKILYLSQDQSFDNDIVNLRSTAEFGIGKRTLKRASFEITLDKNGISDFVVDFKNRIVAKRIFDDTAY